MLSCAAAMPPGRKIDRPCAAPKTANALAFTPAAAPVDFIRDRASLSHHGRQISESEPEAKSAGQSESQRQHAKESAKSPCGESRSAEAEVASPPARRLAATIRAFAPSAQARRRQLPAASPRQLFPAKRWAMIRRRRVGVRSVSIIHLSYPRICAGFLLTPAGPFYTLRRLRPGPTNLIYHL